MIPRAAITAWSKFAPWPSRDQIEHDLVLSRAICDLYSHPLVSKELAFRGGTALHKLFFEESGRFSEDLDFVQVTAQPIGEVINAVRDCLDEWLGKPSWKQNKGLFVLNYHFETETTPSVIRKVKVEINTREHFSVQKHIYKELTVQNSWFSGNAKVLTYTPEELLGTKLRALYQRKKGRDLYDLWYANRVLKLDIIKVIDIFNHYVGSIGKKISRAEFEANIFNKKTDKVFTSDIMPLLSADHAEEYDFDEALKLVQNKYITKLLGDAWKKPNDET